MLVVHVGPHDVGGQQVRGELNSLELAAECGRECVRHQRLGEAWIILDEHVGVGEDSDGDSAQILLLSDDDFRNFAHQTIGDL